jgi:hypothetical protein
MKTLIWVVAMLVATATISVAAEKRTERHRAAAIEQFSSSLAPMPLLPRRHQNHCGYHDGHFVCADHCGVDYQIYFCSRTATGCCHIGRGYCDDTGKLRCSPAFF